MFENPRRCRQARNYNQSYENSRFQIVFRTDIFPKLTLVPLSELIVMPPCKTHDDPQAMSLRIMKPVISIQRQLDNNDLLSVTSTYPCMRSTVKPVLSGHHLLIKRTVAEVPKFVSLIYFKWNLKHGKCERIPQIATPGGGEILLYKGQEPIRA